MKRDEVEPPGIPELCARIRPQRHVTGMSALLLPFDPSGEIDWRALEAHVERTASAGLTPAVNMDTGYVQLLDDTTRLRVLDVAREHGAGNFVAGAQVPDQPRDPWRADPYLREIQRIQEHGGTPIVFPSHGLSELAEPQWVSAHAELARHCDRFLAFELGPMFVPYGRIYSLDAYAGLMEIPSCIGAKHSSLDRRPEWERLALRDRLRPDFLVLTGNDLGIDMVMYGSDYLLGLSTFAPDLFARRDAWWEAGDPRFYQLNDALQYLGCFAFREPVPAYRHSAAQFLRLRGWIESDATHPHSPRRPESDREVLREIARSLGVLAA
jgi:dihydrodipicolinate synthase/N-acetylneuraminate lyase